MRILNPSKAWARGVCLALLLAGSTAWGQGIIYMAPAQQTYYSLFYPGTLDFDIDIKGDGSTDLILRSNDPGSGVNNAVLIPQGNNAIVVQNSYVADINAGDIIGSSLNPVYQWSNAMTPIGTAAGLLGPGDVEDGNFVGQASGFMGFDIVEGGANYYGWMQVANTVSGDTGIYGEITGWAYESTPNTPIAAGAVPEPGTFGLLAFGLVALVSTLRNRI